MMTRNVSHMVKGCVFSYAAMTRIHGAGLRGCVCFVGGRRLTNVQHRRDSCRVPIGANWARE